MPANEKSTLSVFVVAMMNVAVIMNLWGLPIIAKEGLQMFFYLFFAAILFLIPVSLVSAELATGWPVGGVYQWVKEAFGPRLGLTAIWLQWIQNTIWYATVLAFISTTLTYVFFNPGLAENRFYIIGVSLLIYWGATFLNFRGLKTASWVTTIFVISGTIVPGLFIILLGLLWFLSGNPLAFLETASVRLLPDFSSFNNIAFLAGTILLFAGMEVCAVHANSMKNPAKDYPRSVLLSIMVIITIFTMGALSISAIIPEKEISLVAGIMQALYHLLSQFHILWLLPVIGVLVSFGTIGSIIAWISGPSKGLLKTAKDGELPPFFAYVNKNGVQTHILWIQGFIVTALLLIFRIMSNVSVAFFMLTALTVILYLLMYLILYAAAIRLRYSRPDVFREFRVPGGKAGMWILSGIGIAAAAFAIIVGFFPPAQLSVQDPKIYVLFLIVLALIFALTPSLINHFKKKEWKIHSEETKNDLQ